MDHEHKKLQLYLRHRRALIDYAAVIVGCRMRAEDLVQEAYLKFVPANGPEKDIAQPVSYLYRIVRNLALDWQRRVSAETQRDQTHSLISAQTNSAPSMEEAAIHRDELLRVDAALSELPENVRAAFEMHRLGGQTFQQIAAQLDVSVATAARWAQQALLHITKRMQETKN